MTSNVHDASAAKLAPVMVRLLLPVRVEPEPQKSLAGRAVAVKPDKVAFKSLLKVMPVAAFERSRLFMEKVSFINSPGAAEVGKTADKNAFWTLNVAVAAPLGFEPFWLKAEVVVG